jgi:hypothetical protein
MPQSACQELRFSVAIGRFLTAWPLPFPAAALGWNAWAAKAAMWRGVGAEGLRFDRLEAFDYLSRPIILPYMRNRASRPADMQATF